MATKSGLGRGLNKGMGMDALISPKKETINKGNTGRRTKDTQNDNKHQEDAAEKKAEEYVNISLVGPNKNQPRKNFNQEALQELADSIKNYGIISPVIVKKNGDFYEIIAGERRWRAAKLAGLKEIPIIVREYDELASAEISLIENIQREDLNPIEEAKAYQRLADEFSLKQEEIASKVAKSRVFITNSLRLLKLDERVQTMLEDKLITTGHARALLGLSDYDAQYEIAQKVFKENLNVRQLEKLVRDYGKVPVVKKEEESSAVLQAYDDLKFKISEVLGTKVTINRKDNGKGKVEIYYNSIEELERISADIIKHNKNNV